MTTKLVVETDFAELADAHKLTSSSSFIGSGMRPWTVALTVIFYGRTRPGGGDTGAGARFPFAGSADTTTDSVSEATWLP